MDTLSLRLCGASLLLLNACSTSLLDNQDSGAVDAGATGGVTSATGGADAGSGGGDTVASGGTDAGTGGTITGPGLLGTGTQGGVGSSSDQYAKAAVTRDGLPYNFMANGWGPGFQSQSVSWNGTSFTVVSMSGSQGSNYEPASYPTTYCGKYSDGQSGACGLPAAISSITTLQTGWRWAANGNSGQYNAAYDIWVGDGSNLSAYLMVWLRDPPGQQPAGSVDTLSADVAGVPGKWNIWTGQVFGRPIVNYVAKEGSDVSELEFDVMNFYDDALARGYSLPGTHINSVAVGFEIWNGPVSNLQSVDFYVDVN